MIYIQNIVNQLHFNVQSTIEEKEIYKLIAASKPWECVTRRKKYVFTFLILLIDVFTGLRAFQDGLLMILTERFRYILRNCRKLLAHLIIRWIQYESLCLFEGKSERNE